MFMLKLKVHVQDYRPQDKLFLLCGFVHIYSIAGCQRSQLPTTGK